MTLVARLSGLVRILRRRYRRFARERFRSQRTAHRREVFHHITAAK